MIPFDEINRVALAQYPKLLADWLPAGKLVGREYVVGDLAGAVGDSLSINTVSGAWADFATNEKGGDPVSLYAAMRHRGDRVEAAKSLGAALGVYHNGHTAPASHVSPQVGHASNWRPMLPPLPNASDPDLSGYDRVHTYRDPAGMVLFYIRRRDARGSTRKQFAPLTYGVLDGITGWHSKHPLPPRPLYGLDRLGRLPGDPIVCEGEKAADAAQRLFPDRPCLSWPGGTNNVTAADWTPLRGRSVLLWPDNDAPGAAAAQTIAAALHGLACRVSLVRVDDLPEKADAADLKSDDPQGWIAARVVTLEPPAHATEEEPPPDIADPGYFASVLAEAQGAILSADNPAVQDFPASTVGWDEIEAIPPREWVFGTFLIRRFVSVLGAPGGVGKTAYAIALALSICTGCEILGEHVHDPGNVWIYNLEDPRDELLRRLHAAMLRHKISFDMIAERLFLDSGRDRPLVVAKATKSGDLVVSPVVPAMIEEIQRRRVKVMVVDPFVRSHRLEENVNEQIDFAVALWGEVADRGGCALLLLHHFRKGGIAGDVAAFRGASALIDAARSALTLSPMTKDEGGEFGIAEQDCWQYVRLDNAKANLAPPATAARWFKLDSIELGNGNPSYPNGDKVAAITPANLRRVKEGIPPSDYDHILDLIAKGPEPGVLYSGKKKGGTDRWAGTLLMQILRLPDDQAQEKIDEWLRDGTLTETVFTHPVTRNRRGGIVVNDSKRSF